MSEELNGSLDTGDMMQVSQSVKRLASPTSEFSTGYIEPKRVRSSSPPGELEIDLGESRDLTPERDVPSVISVGRWANVFPARNGSGKLVLIPIQGRRVLEEKESTTEKPLLLGKPFWDVFLEAEDELERIRKTPLPHDEPSVETDAGPKGVLEAEQTRARSDGGQENHLWTDKYRPKGFRDLLSDAALNRVLLQWIKLWDPCVFNKEVKRAPEIKHETNNNNNINNNNNNNNKKGYFQRDQLPELKLELDKSRRPMQPLVLVAGPPGLGKTTLAHVLARHAGYNVVELNASDDRSPEAFRSTLESATQMKSVLDQQSRPNCVIIDEIDGAPSQSIAVLLNMLRPEPPAEAKGKQKKKPRVLLRPVICICNDPWGPALRLLRQNAILIQMPSIQSQSLVTRLQDILREERMKFDSGAVQSLAQKTGNDIRSCLSTLQFLHSKKGAINMTDVSGLSVGNKDVQQTLANALNGIFTKPRVTQSSVGASKIDDIPRLVQSFGDNERINQALFDTYIHRKGLDSKMESNITLSMEWLCFADQMHATIQSSQNYSLMAYGPYTAARFHTIHATYRGTKLVMNSSFSENYQKHQKMKHHLLSLLSSSSPMIIAQYGGLNILLEVLPFVLGIIQPQMRSSNVQLLNGEDLVKFRSAIEVMTAFGLVYQQRHIEGRYSFQLEPNIEELVRFPNIEQSFTSLPYAARLMFSRELELQRVRHSDGAVQKQDLKAKPEPVKRIPRVEKVRKDFFGRVVKPNTENAEKSTKTMETDSGVYYKFKEGFSNAVRKTLKIRQIL